MLRRFGDVGYVPILSMRPAEMNALKELPTRDKDNLLPYILLRPWVTAHHLSGALAKLDGSYGARPTIIDLCETEDFSGPKPVNAELREFRNSSDGYAAWCRFIASRPNFIPSIQLEDLDELGRQAAQLANLDRGVVVRFQEQTLFAVETVMQVLSQTIPANSLLAIFDFGQKNSKLLERAAQAVGLVRTAKAVIPACSVAVAATTFPDSFTGRVSQEIFERALHTEVVRASDLPVIYADRGSARAERQTGGGGLPAPRIDLPLAQEWQFFRQDNDDTVDRDSLYVKCAESVMASPRWDPALRVWGVQMIERTAASDPDAIVSPARSTAARINIHLHIQTRYGDPIETLRDTDEDWDD